MKAQSRHYWRNLARALAAALLVGALVIAAFAAGLTAHLSTQTLRPQRIVPVRTPADVGIAGYQDVVFDNGQGVTLRGWYVPSRNGAGIVFAHGYGGNREDLLDEAAILVERGYGALLFDFGGHGTSDDALVTVGDRERRDLVAALDFISAQPDIDPERIGAMGLSMGGATLALVAAQDQRVQAVVIEAAFPALENVIADKAGLLGPLTSWPARWAIQREGVDIDAVRPAEALCAISPRPVLLIYGERDTVVPPGSAETMFAAACDPAERWLVPAGGHGKYLDDVPEVYRSRLLQFFDAVIGP